MKDGTRKEGFAVVTFIYSLESSSHMPRTSAQLADLMAMTMFPQLEIVNIYTNMLSQSYMPAAIWKERNYLTANGFPRKYHKETDDLFIIDLYAL